MSSPIPADSPAAVFDDIYKEYDYKYLPSEEREPTNDNLDRRDGRNGSQWNASLDEWRKKYGDLAVPKVSLMNTKDAFETMRTMLRRKLERFERGSPWYDVGWKGTMQEFFTLFPGWDTNWSVRPQTVEENALYQQRIRRYDDPEYKEAMRLQAIGDRAFLVPKGCDRHAFKHLWPTWDMKVHGRMFLGSKYEKVDGMTDAQCRIVYEQQKQALVNTKRQMLAAMRGIENWESVTAVDVTKYQNEKFREIAENTAAFAAATAEFEHPGVKRTREGAPVAKSGPRRTVVGQTLAPQGAGGAAQEP